MDTALREKILARKRAGGSKASVVRLNPAKTGHRQQNKASLANLIPAKPGDVRNPKGINQYTAGASYRDKLDEVWLERALKNPESLVLRDDQQGPMCLQCGMRKCDLHLGFDVYAHSACLDRLEGLTAIQVCALQERCWALRGDGDARTHMRKTFHPAPNPLTLQGDAENPIAFTQVIRRIVD